MLFRERIKAVLEDDSLDDKDCFERIERIVCLFEEIGSDCGARHDFGWENRNTRLRHGCIDRDIKKSSLWKELFFDWSDLNLVVGEDIILPPNNQISLSTFDYSREDGILPYETGVDKSNGALPGKGKRRPLPGLGNQFWFSVFVCKRRQQATALRYGVSSMNQMMYGQDQTLRATTENRLKNKATVSGDFVFFYW